jgi:hypothetical protein
MRTWSHESALGSWIRHHADELVRAAFARFSGTLLLCKGKTDHKHSRVGFGWTRTADSLPGRSWRSKVRGDAVAHPQLRMEIVSGGTDLATRFPRPTGRWREDKAPEDGATEKEVVDMYREQLKRAA